MSDDEIPAIVIDSGSGTCMGGFADEDAPRTAFSSTVGAPRFGHEELKIDSVVGDQAQIMREFVSVKYPIERGIVTSWNDAEKIWNHCFENELRVDPTKHPVLMSEPVLSPAAHKESVAECMFEKFQVPAFFPSNSATLNLFSYGRGVGLVLDIGKGLTQAVPIHQTDSSHQAVLRQEYAGQDVTSYLQQLLHQRGYSFTTTAELEYVREIKEAACYTSLYYESEMANWTPDSELILPDGNKVFIGKEKFQCAECLFQPSLSGHNGLKGLHEMLESCIQDCDLDIRKDFYCNIILCGGASMMPGLADRLRKEWKKIIPPTMVSHVVAMPERKYSVWIGGSILASLSTFQDFWVTKKDYEEFGPSLVHRRCV